MEVMVKIVRGKYLDSVKLMNISKALRELPGVTEAVAILNSAENRQIMAATDMLAPELDAAKDNDIAIVIKAVDLQKAENAVMQADVLINAKPANTDKETGIPHARTLDKALDRINGADICIISVNGKYAAAEAMKALKRGLHVLLFSDNVSLEDERRLKNYAVEHGLLLMGPDCGTSILNGTPLAFANAVPSGNIGIISASGTGLQEVSAGIANRGFGISQGFGTGGRDGKKEVGGAMILGALDFLVEDDNTKVIVLIGKTPDSIVLDAIWDRIAGIGKPVIANFLKEMPTPDLENLIYCTSLEKTAELACVEVCTQEGREYIAPFIHGKTEPIILSSGRKYVRGLYSGGTLCGEAVEMYKRFFGRYPMSNLGSDPQYQLKDLWQSEGDTFIDLGADDFTVGRPHPMIDFELRLKRIRDEAADPVTAIILLDVVLGWGAHPDPAAELVPVLRELPQGIGVVIHLLGTDGDPQQKSKQKCDLETAGARVFEGHEQAVEFAFDQLQDIRRGQ
jgi:FdrA protein